MRFSLLTLSVGELSQDDVQSSEWVECLARYIAEHNVSCACLQKCEQSISSPLVDAESGVRTDNLAFQLSARLINLGLKYEMVWTPSMLPEHGRTAGCAILGQLPMLADARSGADGTERASEMPCAVAARFAIAPGILIDACTTSIADYDDRGAASVNQLREFISRSQGDLGRRPAETRRRGRPPRQASSRARSEPVRIVLLAGDMPDDPSGSVASALQADGFADVSQLARPPASESPNLAEAASENGWAEHVYIRPGIKPTDVSLAFAGDVDACHTQHAGLLVSFEV